MWDRKIFKRKTKEETKPTRDSSSFAGIHFIYSKDGVYKCLLAVDSYMTSGSLNRGGWTLIATIKASEIIESFLNSETPDDVINKIKNIPNQIK
jgi:hypothetical protein